MELAWIENLVQATLFYSMVETKEVSRSIIVAAEYTTDREMRTHKEGRPSGSFVNLLAQFEWFCTTLHLARNTWFL